MLKTNLTETIKEARIKLNLTQMQMAEKFGIDEKTYRSLEQGKSSVEMGQLLTLLELQGLSADYLWTILLKSDDYKIQRLHIDLKRHISNESYAKVKKSIESLELFDLSRKIMSRQLVAYAKIVLAVEAGEINNKTAISQLKDALQMTISSFDETKISSYKLTHNEVLIVIEISRISTKSNDMNDMNRSLKMLEALIKNRDSSLIDEIERARLYPTLYLSLSIILTKMGKHDEALTACQTALKICRKYQNFIHSPQIQHYLAYSHFMLGEEERIYRPHLERAYHCAYAMGLYDLGEKIKKSAEEDFSINNF